MGRFTHPFDFSPGLRAALCVLSLSALSADRASSQGVEIKTWNGASDVTRLKIESGAATEEGYFLNVNLGVGGTTAPDKPLAIQGTGAQHEWISFKDSAGVTQWHLNRYNSTGFNFAETGVADGRLYLEDGGFVGIGTTNPSQMLHIAGTSPRLFMNAASSNLIDFGTTGVAAPGAGSVGQKIRLWGTGAVAAAQYAIGIEASHVWFSHDQAVAGSGFKWYNSGGESMRLQGNAYLGIGTAPSFKIHTSGTTNQGNTWSSRGNFFMCDRGSTVSLTNNAYVNDAGSWVNADGASRGVTLELRDSGVMESYGIVTAGATDWRQMFGYNAPSNYVYFPSGNVGIGDSAPADKLDVHGNVRLNDNQIYLRGHGDTNHGFSYQAGPPDGPQVYGWNGVTFEDRNGGTTMLCNFDTSDLAIGPNLIESTTATGTVRWKDNDGGNIHIDYIAGSGGSDLRVYNSSPSTSKDFILPHPSDPDRYLIHACLEGPEYAVYYRGTGRLEAGRAEVVLPAYFEALTREAGRTVLLTPEFGDDSEPVSALAHDGVRDGRFRVWSLDAANPGQTFSWEVSAVRRDVPVLRPEPRRDEIDVHGIGPYTYYTEKRVSLYPE